METPNGNPIASILPGLPTLQHRDSVIVMFRSGVDPHQVADILRTRFYPVDEGVDRNFSVSLATFAGKLPSIASVVSSLSTMPNHPGVIKPEYEADPDAVVPADGYMPFISLKIMPYQQTRMSVLEAYTPNIYIVTAGLDHLMFERWKGTEVTASIAAIPRPENEVWPAPMGVNDLNTGSLVLNGQVGSRAAGTSGLELKRTSLWLALPHEFKTGMLLSLATCVPMFTRGSLGGLRSVILVSGENSVNQMAEYMYRQVKYICDGTVIEESDGTTDEERVTYINSVFEERGWKVYLYKAAPGALSDGLLEHELARLVDKNIKVDLVAVDHLSLHSGPNRTSKELLRELNGLRDHYGFHLAVTDNLSGQAKVELRKEPDVQQWLTKIAIEGIYDTDLAKEADRTYLQHVMRDREPRLVVKAAGFESGLPSFSLPLTAVGGYTYERR